MAEKNNQLECAECGDSGVGLEAAGKLWVKDRSSTLSASTDHGRGF